MSESKRVAPENFNAFDKTPELISFGDIDEGTRRPLQAIVLTMESIDVALIVFQLEMSPSNIFALKTIFISQTSKKC